jgi:hypothetical protein
MLTASGIELRLLRRRDTVLARSTPRHCWLAAGLQLGLLAAAALLWAAGPSRPPVAGAAARPAAAHTAATPPTYGPPLPRQMTSASLRTGRLTSYPPASVAVLLSAGDRAQRVGHAEQAIGFYEQILRENPGDPRAVEAAFTAGRLLLHALDRPRQAAQHFAQARGLAPHGPMAEDALAQEIACWMRARMPARARARAVEFRALYPGAPLPELLEGG